MANEITSIFLPYLVGVVARAGVDPAPHLRGLAIEHLRPLPGRRFDWNEFAIFFNRATEAMSIEMQERLGEFYVVENGLIQSSARIIVAPRSFLRFLGTMAEIVYNHLRYEGGDLPDGRVRWAISIPRHYEGCLPFFRGNIGEFRTVTRLWGLGDCDVEADFSPWHGEYSIRLPEGADEAIGPSIAARVVNEFTSAMEHLLGRGPAAESGNVLRLQREHGLTRAEARVASRLATGLDVSAIAGELGVGVETVRSHLKRAYAKTGTNRQAELVRLVLTDL